ncbi:MAG: cytochrome bc complex cytochrome b subunit [Candidatus Latescibacteria bacterium]|nr:cytochrome bc complex cytochrome b subunit [Candidatus Latescibacterota bacterium]NIM21407.1 cytochrome bc complex cytochrome b subunit [Candidatus Latescibacterota bacterium]NIM65588.1 cytochrome bc complex cytochrome b subunit [Candidatus Latescibacterota bacterium]NIO01968.1 cytochrome bc complex cytochrome b subunit [Candidatus Latescibacterota bacterium]NIO28781.1 cytochrome bc complex cytochrome b subunit [Candidatus Latescibacterota bacterium]
MGAINRAIHYLDERLQIQQLIDFGKKKSVPLHRETVWYYFGGVTLFLFIIQVITGILLLFYYRTGPEEAYESIRFIMSEVRFGWLMRSIHSWSANLMILAAFIHMFSVFFAKAYRKPRELTWITGMLLLFIGLGLGFTGYLLPWNELAFFATKVGTDIFSVVPVIGEPLLRLLRGGEEVTPATLSRFFGIHVAIFPLLFVGLLALHLLFVQRQGMSEPIGWNEMPPDKTKSMPFFPNFLLRDLLLWLIVLNVIALLAVFFPWELGEKADPFAPAPEGIKPEWYFMFMYQTLKFLPAKVLFISGETLGILVFGLAVVLWLIIPFWDRKSARGEKNRALNYVGLFVVLFIIVMTVLGYALH